jgi:hypothetical protein
MSDPVPPLPASPLMIGRRMNSGIDIYSDNIEYKTIKSMTLEHLDIYVNNHIKDGWKLYGDMKVIDTGRISSSTHELAFYQTLIRKLPGQGGGRSPVRTRKAKLKSHPPNKRA